MVNTLTAKLSLLPAEVESFLNEPKFLVDLEGVEKYYGVTLSGYVAELLIGNISMDEFTDILSSDDSIGSDLAPAVAMDILIILGPVHNFLTMRGAPMSIKLPTTASVLEDFAVKKIREQWKAQGAKAEDIAASLAHAIMARDKLTVLAAFGSLAILGELRDILKKQKFATMLTDYYQSEQKVVNVQAFKLAPSEPRHLKTLMRWVLEKQIGCSLVEAARAAVDLVNLMNRTASDKLQHWAYFDAASGQYRWL